MPSSAVWAWVEGGVAGWATLHEGPVCKRIIMSRAKLVRKNIPVPLDHLVLFATYFSPLQF